MFIETLKTIRLYERQSKLGVNHTFKRKNTLYVFKCDCCGITFLRSRSKVDPMRATNDFKHVCPYCDNKQFAQNIGVKMRKFYKTDASSNTPIGSNFK
jgi:ribosomal protein L37AE/L43A